MIGAPHNQPEDFAKRVPKCESRNRRIAVSINNFEIVFSQAAGIVGIVNAVFWQPNRNHPRAGENQKSKTAM